MMGAFDLETMQALRRLESLAENHYKRGGANYAEFVSIVDNMYSDGIEPSVLRQNAAHFSEFLKAL